MRWPWEWGRRADVTDAGAGEAGDSSRGPAGGSAGAAAGATALPATPSSPRAWASLPPVQRSLADTAPSVAPPDAFRSSLTTQQNPGFLAPLGHLVDRDGPSGVVGGLAASVAEPIAYEGAPELRVPDRPAEKHAPAVQRRVAELRPEPRPMATADARSPSPSPSPSPAPPSTSPVDSSPAPESVQAAPPPVESAPVEAALLAEQPVVSHSTDIALSGADGAADAVPTRRPDRAAGETLVVARQVDSPASSTPARSSVSSSAGAAMSSAVTIQCLADDHTGHDHLSADQPATDRQAGDRQAGDRQAGDRLPDDHPAEGPAVVGESAADPYGASMPSVAQRSASADPPPSVAPSAAEQPVTARPEVAAPILGSRPKSAAPVESPAPAEASPTTRTTESLPALVVPVQRTTSTSPGRPQPRTEAEPARFAAVESGDSTGGGDATPPVQRLAAEPGTSQHPAIESDSAREVPEPATAPDPFASGETAGGFDASAVPSAGVAAPEAATEPTTGLLADQAPLVGTIGALASGDKPDGPTSADPLIVAGQRPDPANVVQRLATAQTESTGTPSLAPPQTFQQPAAAAEPPVRGVAGAPAGGPGSPAGDVGDHAEYPPMVARSVQRRATDAESGRAADQQTPLSGFAAAISALNGDPPVRPLTSADPSATDPAPAAGSSELVVARQVATTPTRAGTVTPPARPAGVALSSASSFAAPPAQVVPELVVARRVAPDGGGNLPAADVRLTTPMRLAGAPRADIGDPSSIVQRSLIADQPPLVPNDPSPGSAEAIPSAPAVQRIQYEDLAVAPTDRSAGDAREDRGTSAGSPAHGQIARGAVPTTQRAVAAGSTSGSVSSPGPDRFRSSTTATAVRLDPVGSLGPINRTEATLPSSSPSAPAPPSAPAQAADRSMQRALGTMPNGVVGPGLPVTAVQRTTPASPAPVAELTPMVQRRFDAPPSTATPAPVESSTSAVSGVSGRTVGLAEMFALASAQAGAETVQRSAEESAPSPAETEVQLEAASPSSPSASPSAPAAGPAGAAAPSGADLDEMARRLYEPLTARLRAELWQDRERSGLLTDLRP